MKKAIGQALRKKREQLGLSKAHISREWRITRVRIDTIENGGNYNINSLIRLAEAVGAKIEVK